MGFSVGVSQESNVLSIAHEPYVSLLNQAVFKILKRISYVFNKFNRKVKTKFLEALTEWPTGENLTIYGTIFSLGNHLNLYWEEEIEFWSVMLTRSSNRLRRSVYYFCIVIGIWLSCQYDTNWREAESFSLTTKQRQQRAIFVLMSVRQ